MWGDISVEVDMEVRDKHLRKMGLNEMNFEGGNETHCRIAGKEEYDWGECHD